MSRFLHYGAANPPYASGTLHHEPRGPFSPWGEGARRADEGAFITAGKEVPPHQFGQMTYGRAIEVVLADCAVCAAVSHGLTSSPRGERENTRRGDWEFGPWTQAEGAQ